MSSARKKSKKVTAESDDSDFMANVEPASKNDVVSGTRRSSHPSKPKTKKTFKDVCDSDDDSEGSDDKKETKRKREAVSKPAKAKPQPPVNISKAASKTTPEPEPAPSTSAAAILAQKSKGSSSKSTKSDDDTRDSNNTVEKDEGTKAKSKSKRTTGRSKAKGDSDGETSDDDFVIGDLAYVDDGESSTNVWHEPDYTDKVWFKKMCLSCQVCKKEFKTTGDAQECFSRHHNYMRCLACFILIPNGKDATQRLFKHYLKRHHEPGKKRPILKCPFCNKSVKFKDLSPHIAVFHIPNAVGIPGPRVSKGNKENLTKNTSPSERESDAEGEENSESEGDDEIQIIE